MKPRPPLIVVLLVLALVLVVALSWQAYRATSSHQRAAEDALRDYARLAAGELRVRNGVHSR